MQKILGITSDGYGAGKDSVANILAHDFGYLVFGFTEVLMNSIYEELLYKKFSTRNLWYQYCSEHKYESNPSSEGFWVRKLLQGYGQYYRSLDHDYWVKQWEMSVHAPPLFDISVPSVRFPNEANKIKDLGGAIIKIVRPGIVIDNDPSERSMLYYPVDYSITNDGTMKDLRKKVHEMMGQLELTSKKENDRFKSEREAG